MAEYFEPDEFEEKVNRKKAEVFPSARFVCFILLAEVSFKQTCECLAVSCFATEILKNTAKTGIFNRLAQNQHKNIKIYAVDFSS